MNEWYRGVKCPNCGSTAQVKCVWRDDSAYTNYLYREYECGCGCKFRKIYEATDTQILSKKEG